MRYFREDFWWPPTVVDRNPEMHYAYWPGQGYACPCGVPVRVLQPFFEQRNEMVYYTPVWRFQHGDNPEAVREFPAGELTLEMERDMQAWVDEIHAYDVMREAS